MFLWTSQKEIYVPKLEMSLTVAKNRHGEIECYPLLSISLAVLNIPGNSRLTPTMLGERAALLKKRAKNVTRSCFVMEDPLALTAVGD